MLKSVVQQSDSLG